MEGQIPCTASQRAWSLEHNARICHSHDFSFITHKTHITKHNKTIPHHHQSFGWVTRCCSVPRHCASFCWGSAGSIPQPHLTQMELKFAGDPHHLLVRNPTVKNTGTQGFISHVFSLGQTRISPTKYVTHRPQTQQDFSFNKCHISRPRWPRPPVTCIMGRTFRSAM